jgi:hypothetical protein
MFVCEEWGYQARKDAPEFQDKEKLIVALGEAISPVLERNPFPTGSQVPAYLVAAILVQADLDQLCGDAED